MEMDLTWNLTCLWLLIVDLRHVFKSLSLENDLSAMLDVSDSTPTSSKAAMLGRFSSFAKANALIALHINISRLTYWSVTAKHKPADSTPPADQQLIHRIFFVETFLCCPLISSGQTTIICFKPLQIWAQINSWIIHWVKACVYLPDLPFLTHSDWNSKNCPTQCVTCAWDVCPIFRIFLLLLHQCYSGPGEKCAGAITLRIAYYDNRA